MKSKTSTKAYVIDFFILVVSRIMLLITIALVFVAVFDKNNSGEAPIGSFDYYDYDDGWILEQNGSTREITLPDQIDVDEGEKVSLTNTLPDNLSNQMSFMIRASMQDMYIYVDDELREEYSSKSINDLSYYIPSAYVVTKLDAEDSGKTIRIDIRFKSLGIINAATIGYGNDVWYPILADSLLVNMAAIIVLVLGIILTVAVAIMNNSLGGYHASRYLGLLMIDIALWVISESTIRQFVFSRPSLTEIFAFLTVELMGALACMYFDAVQHDKYHKIYRVVEIIVLSQLLINLVLHITRICDMYKTLIISHFWTAVGIVVVICTIVKDFIDKDIKKYRLTAMGMACFILMSIIELAGFYITRFRVLGTFVCVGLVLLMTFTIVQALYDAKEASAEREKKQLDMLNNTIETIAGSIDAKDEYTGGHSERVGLYAERLAREIAADYGFSEEDILRIRYIGLVHDIGKIGVADSVLNKAGRLTDEEFSLMKKHTEIGYEIMGATGESMEGLLDGIRYHHERFDGKGYPQGLSYTDIPLIARILALADSYDAMTSNRVYRKRLTDEEVRNELIRCSGTQFDPALTDAFVKLIDQGELQVNTDKGMAVSKSGEVLKSSMLENKLQSDLLQKKHVHHPTHVRMMCYVIKLMEKKDKDITVIFYGPNVAKYESEEEVDSSWDEINSIAKSFITGNDMIIRYSDELNVIALFDKSKEEIKEFMHSIRDKSLDAVIKLIGEYVN